MLMKMTLEDLAENKTKHTTAIACGHLKTSHLNDILVKTLQKDKKKPTRKELI